MLTVSYKKMVASWDSDEFIWHSSHAPFAKMLNRRIPDAARKPEAPFRKDGVEGLVLAEAKAILGDELEVLIFEVPEPPEDVEGEDH